MKQRSLRFRQLGHANFFQSLLGGGKKTEPAKGAGDPNDPTKKAGDPNDPNANKEDPNDPNNFNKNKSPENPLTAFEGLFNMDTSKKGEATPTFSIDPEALNKVVGGMNFAGQLTPELLDKLKSGDAQTTTDILNSLGRNVYSTLMQHLPVLTDKYVNARLEHSQKGLGKSVKQTLTQQSLTKLAANNPILKEQLDTISGQLLEKFPDADPDWIAEQTGEYFLSIGKLINPNAFKSDDDKDDSGKPDPKDISQRQGFEWGKYLMGNEVPPAGNK